MDHDAPSQPHPVCVRMTQLRLAAGLSRPDVEAAMPDIRAIALASYERGHREPPLHKIDKILALYGMRLDVVPIAQGAATVEQALASMHVLSTSRVLRNQLDIYARQLEEMHSDDKRANSDTAAPVENLEMPVLQP